MDEDILGWLIATRQTLATILPRGLASYRFPLRRNALAGLIPIAAAQTAPFPRKDPSCGVFWKMFLAARPFPCPKSN